MDGVSCDERNVRFTYYYRCIWVIIHCLDAPVTRTKNNRFENISSYLFRNASTCFKVSFSYLMIRLELFFDMVVKMRDKNYYNRHCHCKAKLIS